MFFKRKEAVQTLEINHAYEEFQNNMNIILLCVDDDLKFDVRHPVDAQCYPARLIDQHAKRILILPQHIMFMHLQLVQHMKEQEN